MLRRDDFVLRAMGEEDLEVVRGWRNLERVRANMFTDHIISVAEHRAWFERLKEAGNTFCFIAEYCGKPYGVVKFDKAGDDSKKCVWGFYLGDTGVPRGYPVVMGFLALEQVFEEMGFEEVGGEVFAYNDASVKYHLKLGFKEGGRLRGHVLKKGVYEDVVTFALTKDDWLKGKEELETRLFNPKEAGHE